MDIPVGKSASLYRSAGWAAIASGTIGVVAYGFLVAFLSLRSQVWDTAILMVRLHDAGVVLQFVLIIPVVFGLYNFSQQRSPGMSKAMLRTGIIALSLTSLFLVLGIVKFLADIIYMFPQGIFGVWLIVVCWRMQAQLSSWICWFGMVVGLGLALVGTFVPIYACFVSTVIIQIPAADASASPQQINLANHIIHVVLWIGSLMGVATLPAWTLLLGRKLLRERSI